MSSQQPLYGKECADTERTDATASGDDRLLWKAFKAGSDQAYALIYQRHFLHLYDYGMRVTSDEDSVKDCIQDLFLHIWKNRQNLADVNSIKYYLMQSVKRRLISQHSRSTKLSFTLQDSDFPSPETAVLTEQELINQQTLLEQNETVIRALEKLTVRQKEAIILKFYNNRQNDEIARAMSISQESVYNIIYQALGRLKNTIGKMYLFLLLLWEAIF
ncbi:RNA polymerase sigma factor [Larkinella rosea]|uniref:Sigma-70 family RNA polymerase sigma factor n=1 Tax=Larkinella rosea TaxID=2025312 RepID=A0A3P1C359_9BACT|nr:sigma-70 family RNA polymerase sigma factor [Larkinella rosea]RRB07254.1 sigma-70 family RNA polymerase sigma factor [Larkinella rosea]